MAILARTRPLHVFGVPWRLIPECPQPIEELASHCGCTRADILRAVAEDRSWDLVDLGGAGPDRVTNESATHVVGLEWFGVVLDD